MKHFESLKEIEQELQRINLERKILREEIKKNYFELQSGWKSALFSTPIIKSLTRIGVQYLINHLIKK